MLKHGTSFVLGVILTLIFLLTNATGVYASEQDGIFNTIDKYLEKQAEETHIPGMAVVIVDKENVLFSGTYGDCNNADTPFIIGSNSKSFTAAAIMQLAEQGRINLDDHISTYIPDIREGSKITIRQLMNHTSGISTYETFENYKVSSKQGEWVYANVNYSIPGQIIEAVSGKSYADYVKEHFFEPLEMDHSYTSITEAKSNGLIPGYRNYMGIMVKEELPYPDKESKGWLSIPAGYIISSASDMGKYLQFYLNSGKGLLKPESIHTMFYDTVKVMEDASYGFAWGTIESFSEPVIYHNGLVENYISYMFILPESETGGVILMNCNDYLVANALIDKIFKGVLSLLLDEEPQYIGAFDYDIKHLILNSIYLAITAICLLPLVLIGRWEKRCLTGSRKNKIIAGIILLHVLVPTMLLIFPPVVGVPYAVVKGFVPDVYIILTGNAILAYCTGIIKIFLMISKLRKPSVI